MRLLLKPLPITVLVLLLLGKIPGSLAQTPLDTYLREGLQNNIVLKQKNIGLEKALYSLKTANSYFLPSVNLASSYTHGEGGRSIALPVGDLLNPVYATLNQMIQRDDFPQIPNVEQNFFPSNFVDAHVRTSLPLVNTDLYYNRSIRQQQVQLQEYEVKVYARELVRNIKTAYYNYLSATDAIRIYESALELVEQNVEVNQSLLRNGKGLPASVLRAESEREAVNAQLAEARNNQRNAQRYFNFLLNREQTGAILTSLNAEAELSQVSALLAGEAGTAREELEMLKTGERISHSLLRMNQNFWLPKVNAFLDLGAQAENMNWTSRSRYYLVGVSLDIPLFNGGRNNYKIRESLLDLKSSQLSLANTARQLEMSTELARNNLHTAYQTYTASQQRLRAAQSYYRLIEKGYKEGSNSMIEFIDGRNQLTSAQLQVNINTYQVLSAMAQYERETATYPLD